jgi:hypothetical protein
LKPLPLLLAAVGFCVSAALALALIRNFQFGDDPMAMIVGATVGTQVGVIAHSRQPGARATRAAKTWLAAVLAAMAIAFGLAVQFAFTGFEYPEITLPMSAIGSFVFPYAIFGSTWRALGKTTPPNN